MTGLVIALLFAVLQDGSEPADGTPRSSWGYTVPLAIGMALRDE